MTAPRIHREPPPPMEIHSLAELLRNPRLLDPPPAHITPLLYHERVTLLAGREKDGKSTLASAAIAALSREADFLGHSTKCVSVLWLTEEHPGEPTRRFHTMGADPDFIDIGQVPHTGTPGERVSQIADAVAVRDYEIIVVDTLSVLMRGLRSHNDSAEVGNLMGPLVQIARDHRVALLLLHHASKGTGGYRDSTEIGARVDVIAEMAGDKTGNQRKLAIRGRFGTSDLTLAYNGVTYTLAPRGELSVDAQVRDFITANPGCSQRDIVRQIGKRADHVRDALRALEAARQITVERRASSNRYHVFGYAPAVHPEQQEMLNRVAMRGAGAAMDAAL